MCNIKEKIAEKRMKVITFLRKNGKRIKNIRGEVVGYRYEGVYYNMALREFTVDLDKGFCFDIGEDGIVYLRVYFGCDCCEESYRRLELKHQKALEWVLSVLDDIVK